MLVTELALEERIKTGRSHLAVVDYTDLNGTAGTAKTLQLDSYIARDILSNGLFDLVTPFVGTDITNLTLKVGVNGATVDDDDNLIEAKELAAAGTEILAAAGGVNGSAVDETYGTQEAAVLASLRALAPFAAQEAGNVEAVFTATGANLTALTAGKVRIYFNKLRLTELRNINGL